VDYIKFVRPIILRKDQVMLSNYGYPIDKLHWAILIISTIQLILSFIGIGLMFYVNWDRIRASKHPEKDDSDD
jgi:uncharacterized membrane protein